MTTAKGYTVFGTAIGTVGIAWSDRAIVATHLPRSKPALTEAAIAERAEGAPRSEPPEFARTAMQMMARHLAGELNDLRGIRVDYGTLTPFQRAVCVGARAIRPGETRSYGELAEVAGKPGAARAVGQVMATNELPIIVPCHRVLAAGGKPGGFGAQSGLTMKAQMLAIEGVQLMPRKATSLFRGDGTTLPFEWDEAVEYLSRVDPALGEHIQQVGDIRLQTRALLGTYEALAESIIYQQLSGKAAATIASRVKALFGRDSYPPPAVFLSASDEKLRGAGLSRNKLLAIRDLADKSASGVIPSLVELDGYTDDELVEKLTVVRGIGRWTVEMLLIFRLARPDVLPVDDLGVRKGFGKVFMRGRMPTPEQVTRRGERWRPFRTVGSWYMWRALS